MLTEPLKLVNALKPTIATLRLRYWPLFTGTRNSFIAYDHTPYVVG